MTWPARRPFAFATHLATLALTIALSASSAWAGSLTTESKYAAIVVDANSGEVLYAKKADSPRYPASITKIMTLYLAFEAISQGRLHLNEYIPVSRHAAGQAPTKLGIRAGQSVQVDDAIRATAVKSANDMAVVLAERIGGSEPRFAALMTLRAQELGMTQTHFANASGLPDRQQLSSARDIAILSRAVMRDYPQYYAYFGQKQFYFNGQSLKNHNGLLGKMPGVDGLKTGFTAASGFNLAASAVRDNRRLIAVVLGGNSTAARDNHVEDLLDTGFDVLRRRKNGERITIAQNLFEEEPTGVLSRPPTEQGSGDQEGLKILVSDEDEQPPVQVGATRTASKPKSPSKASGNWSVQVGAFRSRKQAQTHLKTVSKKFRSQLAAYETSVDAAVNGYFRARFEGLSAAAAQQACAAIAARGMSCMVLK
jgi:D-alanyl-D-alanine carboxypeptidase (penicillin-binding protein 5/6)